MYEIAQAIYINKKQIKKGGQTMFEVPECLQKLGVHVMGEEEYKEKAKLNPQFAFTEELEEEDVLSECMMKKLFFIKTNGYNMVVSIGLNSQSNENNSIRYITENRDFPNITGLEDEERERVALTFLESIEDDSSWETVAINESSEILNMLRDEKAYETIVTLEKNL